MGTCKQCGNKTQTELLNNGLCLLCEPLTEMDMQILEDVQRYEDDLMEQYNDAYYGLNEVKIMNERYEARKQAHDGNYAVHDNLTGKTDTNTTSRQIAVERCYKLNTEYHQKRKSEQIMKVAGVGGHGVNLCNEFNFSDLWEVVEWVAQQYGADKPQININGEDFGINSLFAFWFEKSGVWAMKQHEMQTAIVDKIHELMTNAGMIA